MGIFLSSGICPEEVNMSANLEAKKQVVEEIKGKIQASKAVVLVNYNKLTVLEVTALRNKFKDVKCEYKVYKNTLVRKAFNELGVNNFDGDLNGTTATVFCSEETNGLKVLTDAVKADKALEEKLTVKSAYVDNAYVDKKGTAELAAIPAREVLLARMVGSLQSSISKLVYVLDAVAKSKAE
jgi:large subunit ribosomal protein L10